MTNYQFEYIDNQTRIEECYTYLREASIVSIDLEFDKNRFRYGFNLCLIQIFDGKKTFLIDPLADSINLSSIFELLENPAILKIVFSFSEDLRLLHTLNCFPKGLFDLQIAAGLLNFPPSSLARLVQLVLNIYISKSSQQSNWFKRPLTDKQLEYAVQDVIHLPEIYTHFELEFKNKGTRAWIEQEMHHFESSNHQGANQNEVLKEKYKSNMNEVEWHIFSKLMYVREQHAEKINRPSFHVAHTNTLTSIAKNPSLLSTWLEIPSNHKTTKNELFINALQTEINSALDEVKILGLSTRKRAGKRPSKNEYERRKEFEMKLKMAKKEYFKPIQNSIHQEYGEHVKAMVLNNRLIKELVLGKHSNLLPYKKEIILKHQNKLRLNTHSYLS